MRLFYLDSVQTVCRKIGRYNVKILRTISFGNIYGLLLNTEEPHLRSLEVVNK